MSVNTYYGFLESLDNLQGELSLYRDNLSVLNGLMDSLSPHLGERDASDLASLDILLVDQTKCHIQRYRWVPAAKFKYIDFLTAFQLRNTIVETPARILRQSIGFVGLGVSAALNIKDDLISIFGVLFQILLDENEAVVVR